jgi:hypothetical protein
MRTEAEIRAMQDRLRCQILSGGPVAEPAMTTLDWVLNALVSDLELLAVAEVDPNDESEMQIEDVLTALPYVATANTLPGVREWMERLSESQLTELAAAARRIDRECKAEVKKRSKQL